MASSAADQGGFHEIADDILGAEGPVFTRDGSFFMVAPEVEKDGKHAGQILTVNLETGEVTLKVV